MVNICQQSCVNTVGGYECQCTEGYFADMETGTCMAEGMLGAITVYSICLVYKRESSSFFYLCDFLE